MSLTAAYLDGTAAAPLKFDYFRDPSGRPRGVAKMPGSGPTWLSGYVSLKDKRGKSHLVATYAKIKPPLESYERGLCVWNDEKAEFQRTQVLWTKADPPSHRKPVPEGTHLFGRIPTANPGCFLEIRFL